MTEEDAFVVEDDMAEANAKEKTSKETRVRSMRKVVFAALVAATLALRMAVPVSAGAIQTEEPVSFIVYGCTEPIDVTGTVHLMFNVVQNANGFHVVSQANPQGVIGVGEVTGTTYHGVGVTHITFDVGPGSTYTLVNVFDFISDGSAPNAKLKQVEHVTVNADGTVTAVVDQNNVSCA